MNSCIASDQTRLVKGNALNAEDVQRGWEVAQTGQGIRGDLVLLTVGATPSFSFTKGFVINPPNLCTQTLLNGLSTLPVSLAALPAQQRIVMLSSIGLSRASHDALPLALKPLHGYLLRSPLETSWVRNA